MSDQPNPGRQMAAQQPRQSRRPTLREHWWVAVVVGVVVGISLLVLAPLLPPLRWLDHVGADAAAERAAELAGRYVRRDKPRLVFVTVDEDTMTRWRAAGPESAAGAASAAEAERVARAESLARAEPRRRIADILRTARNGGARVVVLDIYFVGTTTAEADDDLRDVLSSGEGAPLILYAPLTERRGSRGDRKTYRLEPGPVYPERPPGNVYFASPRVGDDEDGVVRALRPKLCVEERIRSRPGSLTVRRFERLSIVDATMRALEGKPLLPTEGCATEEPEREDILFLVPPRALSPAEALVFPRDSSNGGPSPERPWFQTFPAAFVPEDALRGAIVIVGQTHNATPEDDRLTPLGAMPGALVHANAIAGRLHIGQPGKVSLAVKLLLKLGLILVAATISLLYWWLREPMFERMGARPDEKFGVFAADFGLFVLVTALSASAVYLVTWVLGAELLLWFGASIGTLVPVAAVAMEAAMEMGHPTKEWLHRGVEWLVAQPGRWLRRGPSTGATTASVGVVVAAMLAAPATAAAQQPAATAQQPIVAGYYQVVAGRADAVVIQRGGRLLPPSGKPCDELYLNDEVSVGDTTTVRIIVLGDRSIEELSGGSRRITVGPPSGGSRWATLHRAFPILVNRLRERPNRPERPLGTPSASTPPPGNQPPGHAGHIASAASDLAAAWSAGSAGVMAGRESPGMTWWFYPPSQPLALDFDPLLGRGPFRVEEGTRTLTLTWSGGTGPFVVLVRDPAAANQVLASAVVPERMATIDAPFGAAGARRVIRVVDNLSRAAIELEVAAVPAGVAPPEVHNPDDAALWLPAAAWLMTAAPAEWRLEGLRRITTLARAGDAGAAAVFHQLRERASEPATIGVITAGGAPAGSPRAAGAPAAIMPVPPGAAGVAAGRMVGTTAAGVPAARGETGVAADRMTGGAAAAGNVPTMRGAAPAARAPSAGAGGAAAR